MKKLIGLVVLSAVFFISCITVTGVSWKGQGPEYLAGIKQMALEFDYSETSVGKFKNEDDYIDKKVSEMNEDEAGKGDEWKEKWVSQKDAVFAAEFEKSLAKKMKKNNVEIGRDLENAPVKAVIHITKIEPGYNIGITSKDAYISIKVKIYKTSDLDNPVDVFEKEIIKGTTNNDFTFDVQKRLASAYYNAGELLGSHLAK
ncbi:MAG TPA: hypothetical protein VLJ60_00815 [bacterium]|nr:hypothetical protein [bacterium]